MKNCLMFLGCMFLASAANAAAIQWTLSNVAFNDGGTASGTFTYDADTNTYSSINLATTSGSLLAGQLYFNL